MDEEYRTRGKMRPATSIYKPQTPNGQQRTTLGLVNQAGGRLTRNRRSVWTIPTAPYPEAHFATFPPGLVEPCIQAGCPEGGAVLDPFAGSGTVGQVAQKCGRRAVLVEAQENYLPLIEKRLKQGVLL